MLAKNVFFTLFIHFFVIKCIITDKSCKIRTSLNTTNPPVVLVKKGNKLDFAQPSFGNGGVYFDLGQHEMVLACTGEKNHLGGIKSEYYETTCSRADSDMNNFNFGQKQHSNLNRVSCAMRVKSYEKELKIECYNRAQLFHLGYNVENKFVSLIEVCHDKKSGRSHYTKHKIQKREHVIHYSYKRPPFSVNNPVIFQHINLNKQYTMNEQSKHLKADGLRLSKHNMFSKGHLVPSADFLIPTWRDISFLFINVQPQWLPINSGKWSLVENKIKQFATKIGFDLEISTGTDGILDIKGTKLFLGPQETLPIPKYFWKLVHLSESDKCIVFISPNYINQEVEINCNETCTNLGWAVDSQKSSIKCCTYQSASAKLKSIPYYRCTSILKY